MHTLWNYLLHSVHALALPTTNIALSLEMENELLNREILLRKLNEEVHDVDRDTLYPFYAPKEERREELELLVSYENC